MQSYSLSQHHLSLQQKKWEWCQTNKQWGQRRQEYLNSGTPLRKTPGETTAVEQQCTFGISFLAEIQFSRIAKTQVPPPLAQGQIQTHSIHFSEITSDLHCCKLEKRLSLVFNTILWGEKLLKASLRLNSSSYLLGWTSEDKLLFFASGENACFQEVAKSEYTTHWWGKDTEVSRGNE